MHRAIWRCWKIACAGLTPAQFGDSTLLEVGDAVAAIGNPLGEELRGTMTDGIISAINRDVNVGRRYTRYGAAPRPSPPPSTPGNFRRGAHQRPRDRWLALPT
ncbi:MAG: trypsin-like peptidase domain-containing protein [Flavonifractor plautii]